MPAEHRTVSTPSPAPDGIVVAPEVAAAVTAGQPVVALESTIFTHGLPRPRNLDVATEAERLLRAAGVVPATIGVADGVPIVGLTPAQIDTLAGQHDAVKLSVRDLPTAVARRQSGGTTVAATAFLAHRAGVRVFATGGLGGVHRGASTSFDESADLVALAHTPITVISAGVKSILDIPATLERLETLNIPVLGYRTDHYPGFYVSDSGHPVGSRADTPEEVAAIVAARDRLRLPAAVLVANPVPADRQLDPGLHDRVLAEALRAATERRITGNATTPFLLDYLHRATGGRSLDVNVTVYHHNAAVAAAIATALPPR